MREILFKAKRLDNGEWVEGSLITDVFCRFGQDIPYIFCPSEADYDCFEDFSEGNGIFEVDTNTICQYTGLTDKNGKKIWENDVVRKTDTNPLGWGRVRNCTVSFDKLGYWLLTTEYGDGYWIAEFESEQLEVIGNIFDNPEFLEGGADHE